ncbi:MAG: hypothetical protein NTV54_15635 [Ignavibacteriales bacterium]|nr:hypothetical protein [Ignavibacteriales bacterium]
MKKAFDCVEMKNDAQRKIYTETKHLSSEELLAYWKRKARAFSKSRQAVAKSTKRIVA